MRTLAVIIAVIFLGWGSVSEAIAQPALKEHRLMVSEHTAIRGISSMLSSPFHPVQILSADVPTTLNEGEDALFSVQANVEHATLPIRAKWTFSDGSVLYGLSVRHAFESPGSHRVEVRVANEGSEANRTFDVNVTSDEQTSD